MRDLHTSPRAGFLLRVVRPKLPVFLKTVGVAEQLIGFNNDSVDGSEPIGVAYSHLSFTFEINHCEVKGVLTRMREGALVVSDSIISADLKKE